MVFRAGKPAFSFASTAAENVLLEAKVVVSPMTMPGHCGSELSTALQRLFVWCKIRLMRQPSAIYSKGGPSKRQICWRRPLPNKLLFVGLASCWLPPEVCADMDAISNVVIARLKVCFACGNDRLRPTWPELRLCCCLRLPCSVKSW